MSADASLRRASIAWIAAAVGLSMAVCAGLRLGTSVLQRGNTYDEQYIRMPIEDLLTQGWSIRTAIDFTESKGPAFIWTYAILGEVVGGALNDLRLITVAFFALGVVPLLAICRWCGIGGPRLLMIAVLYCLIPQHAVLGQLLMSEPSFVFGGLCLMLAFLWGFGADQRQERRIAGPIVFGLLLSILLHHRIHAVAFAGAAALVAFERDRLKSWPWWLACVLAGLSRVPLWVRWGGLVSPAYQQMHSLGLRLDSLTYLAAAMAPLTVAFLWPALRSQDWRRNVPFIAAGAGCGLALAFLAPVDLQRLTHVIIPNQEFIVPLYQGFIATLARNASGAPAAQSAVVGALAIVGLASLGAMAALSHPSQSGDGTRTVLRLQMWTFLCGWAMYALTAGYVFDRFMYAWAVLLPVAWVVALPRWLQVVQALGLAAMLAMWVQKYLM